MEDLTAGQPPAGVAKWRLVRDGLIFFGAHTLFVGLALAIGGG